MSLEVDGAGLRPETTRHVGVQQTFDEILRRVGQATIVLVIILGLVATWSLLRPRYVSGENILKNFNRRRRVKRGNAREQLEDHHPERPPVNLGAVRLTEQNLGRQVVRGSLGHALYRGGSLRLHDGVRKIKHRSHTPGP